MRHKYTTNKLMDRVLTSVRFSKNLRVPLRRVRFADSPYSRLNHYLKIALHCPLSYVGEGQCKAIAVFCSYKSSDTERDISLYEEQP